jgi:hypothetical protein
MDKCDKKMSQKSILTMQINFVKEDHPTEKSSFFIALIAREGRSA